MALTKAALDRAADVFVALNGGNASDASTATVIDAIAEEVRASMDKKQQAADFENACAGLVSANLSARLIKCVVIRPQQSLQVAASRMAVMQFTVLALIPLVIFLPDELDGDPTGFPAGAYRVTDPRPVKRPREDDGADAPPPKAPKIE